MRAYSLMKRHWLWRHSDLIRWYQPYNHLWVYIEITCITSTIAMWSYYYLLYHNINCISTGAVWQNPFPSSASFKLLNLCSLLSSAVVLHCWIANSSMTLLQTLAAAARVKCHKLQSDRVALHWICEISVCLLFINVYFKPEVERFCDVFARVSVELRWRSITVS